MKLKLPLGLLAALLACANASMAQEGTQLIGNNGLDGQPIVDGVTATNGVFQHLSSDIKWQEDYTYSAAGGAAVLNIGTQYGEGKVTVEGGATVQSTGHIMVGGWGFGSGYNITTTPSYSGSIYVGEDSTIVSGAGNSDPSTSQFLIGAGGRAEDNVKGTVTVEGGTLIANHYLGVGVDSNAQGELTVTGGGTVKVQLLADTFSNQERAVFEIGSYANTSGTVVVDASTLTVSAEAHTDGTERKAYTYIGALSDGTLTVRNGSTVDLGDVVSIGEGRYNTDEDKTVYNNAVKGVISVDDSSTVKMGNVLIGNQGSGELTVDGGSTVDISGTTHVGVKDAAAGSSVSIHDNSQVNFGGDLWLGEEEQATMTIDSGADVVVGGEFQTGGAAVKADVSVAGAGTSLTLKDSGFIGHAQGDSTVTISAGATVTAESGLYVATGTSAAQGTIKVDGATLKSEGATNIGQSGTGTLEISNGASVTSGDVLNIGSDADAKGTVKVDGANSVLTASKETYLGKNGNSGELLLSNGSQANLKYVEASGTSTISVTGGSSATIGTGLKGLSIGENAQLIVEDTPAADETGTAAKSAVTIDGTLTNKGTVTADLSEGGSLSSGSLNNSGTMTVTLAEDASYNAGTTVTNSGEMTVNLSEQASFGAGFMVTNSGELNVNLSGDASYETKVINNTGTTNVTLTEGGTMKAASVDNKGTMEVTVGKDSSYSVTNSVENTATGTLTVNVESGGTYSATAVENKGTATVTLAEGSSFTTDKVENTGNMEVTIAEAATYKAETVTNTGTMNMELKEGSTLSVGTYENKGESTITAAANTTCEIAKVDLSGGNLKLEGEGEFDLGGESGGMSSDFYVSGADTTTHIDISTLSTAQNVKFTIDTQSVFTLNFNATALEDIGQDVEKVFTLKLVLGYDGFSVDAETLTYLLENNTYYKFETATTQAVTAGAAAYVVEGAQYTIEGNDLVWTGTVKGIPEPTTATLSLLALAALAARRRRRA